MRQFACCLLVTGTLIGSIANASDQPLRIGVDLPYAPYQYREPDGTISGFEVDIVNAACEHMQRECEWVEQSWDGIIPGLMARKYDFIASAMNITEDRSRQVTFSIPYYQVPSVWVGQAGNDPDVEGDLIDLKIGVQQATIQDEYVTNFYPDAQIQRYSDSASVVADMHAGRLDLVFTAFSLAQETMLNDERFSQYGNLITGPEAIYGPGIGAAFRPRDKQLINDFNQAIQELKENGTFEHLYQRYFDQ